MNNKIIELTLPEWVFLDAHDGKIDHLKGRTVILHIRSASDIEIFNREDVVINDDVLSYKFGYTNFAEIKEHMTAALHYCATLNKDEDRAMIINEILRPCAKWYCEYCKREDKNIIKEGYE